MWISCSLPTALRTTLVVFFVGVAIGFAVGTDRTLSDQEQPRNDESRSTTQPDTRALNALWGAP